MIRQDLELHPAGVLILRGLEDDIAADVRGAARVGVAVVDLLEDGDVAARVKGEVRDGFVVMCWRGVVVALGEGGPFEGAVGGRRFGLGGFVFGVLDLCKLEQFIPEKEGILPCLSNHPSVD